MLCTILFQQTKAMPALYSRKILYNLPPKAATLNKKNELPSKCRHSDKFLQKKCKMRFLRRNEIYC